MDVRIRGAVWTLTLGTLGLVGCGGTAESAEEPRGTDPVIEAGAVDAGVTQPPSVEGTSPVAEATPVRPPGPATPPAARAPSRTPAPPPPAEEPAEPAPPPVLAAGSTMTLSLDAGLSTKDNAAGDAFTASVVADVLAPDGQVLIAAGSRVRGQVVESRESPSSEEPATLVLGVLSIETAAGELPLVADVEDLQVQTEARDSDGTTAGKVAAGAAVGAIVGKIAGNKNRTAVKGAVVGAAAGAVVAAVTKGGHASVPQGAHMVIRLAQPLVIG